MGTTSVNACRKDAGKAYGAAVGLQGSALLNRFEESAG